MDEFDNNTLNRLRLQRQQAIQNMLGARFTPPEDNSDKLQKGIAGLGKVFANWKNTPDTKTMYDDIVTAPNSPLQDTQTGDDTKWRMA